MLKKSISSIIKTILIVVVIFSVVCIGVIPLLRTLISLLLDGPTITIHNDSNETYQAVVALYNYDNPSWLIKLGPSSFSKKERIKISPGASGFSCLYLFKDSLNIPLYAYAPPSVPNEIIEHSLSPNENVYLLSNFSEPCPHGSILPIFKYSGPL